MAAVLSLSVLLLLLLFLPKLDAEDKLALLTHFNSIKASKDDAGYYNYYFEWIQEK